ncbi:TPA: Eaa protein [Escherichia coli]|nr:Eaa protein [Escherichia coli]
MINITKERLLTIKQWRETYGPGSNVVLPAEEAEELARIALASLEAEPVAYIFKHPAGKLFWALTDESNKEQPDVIPVYADSPAPVVPDEIDVNDVPRAVTYFKTHRDCYADGWNACRAAMLQSGNFRENKNSSTNNFREIAETSTNYPVIPSEVLSAIREVAKIRADFDDFDGDRRGIGDCLDEAEQELIVTINKYASQLAAEPIAPNDVREQTAIPQVPVTPDGWISCSERMPNTKTAVLVAVEFDRKGDWRMKWATYIPGHPDANDGWIIPGASWKPSHWMPLPEPPQEVNQ